MTREQLVDLIRRKRSVLCVGLDSEEERLPSSFQQESSPVRAFEQAIVSATMHTAVAYKLNLAFYEARGEQGWLDLESTVSFIRASGEALVIADAKRGDIGNTARKYAEAYFDRLDFDAVTLSPYMGHDSIMPFLGREGKWAIILGITSNEGAMDLQLSPVDDGSLRLFEKVIVRASEWGTTKDTMFVVGATRPELVQRARELAPDHFFLVPGVGAQGGDLTTVLRFAATKEGGLLVNSSRTILYAGEGTEAISKAKAAAEMLQQEMERCLAPLVAFT